MRAIDASFPSQPRALFVGLATVDVEYLLDDFPKRNQKITSASQQITAGGPATNAAVACAFLGAKTTLVTAAGRHPLAEVIRLDLRRYGVSIADIAHEREEAPPLSSVFVFRASGERTVISANAGAFPSLSYQVDSAWLENASIVLVDGHYMPLCQAVAAASRSRGTQVVLDAGSWKPGMNELLANVDIAICSNDFQPPACRNEADVFSYLKAHGVASVAITRGEKPILYVDDGAMGEIGVERVDAADTLGAGDVFHGAFCYWACQPGRSFRRSLQFAVQVATFSCRFPGTRLWMDSFPGVEAIQQPLP